MNFYLGEDLIELPEELVREHEDGRVLFFCGAGISVEAGLPTFDGLVKQVEEALRDRVGCRYNQVVDSPEDFLHLLEQELDNSLDVRQAVAGVLGKEIRSDYPHHKSVLKLARSADGKIRVVTTNFDSLFDFAKKDLGLGQIKEYRAPYLPYSSKWDGIVYLHGKIVTNEPEDLTNLILTSADFGKAYITEGIVARFVIKLLQHYTICFVGYSANDKVVKYLLDSWAAEKRHFKTPRKMYAFADYNEGEVGKTKSEIQKKWESKDITPLLYNSQSGHSVLVETLKVWAERYECGLFGKVSNMKRILSQDPSTVSQSQIVALCSDICDLDASQQVFGDGPIGGYDINWIRWMFQISDKGELGINEFKIKKIFRSLEYTFSFLTCETTRTQGNLKWYEPKCAFNFDAIELSNILKEWIRIFIDSSKLFRVFLDYRNVLSETFRQYLGACVERNDKVVPGLKYLWRHILQVQFYNEEYEFVYVKQVVNEGGDLPITNWQHPKINVSFNSEDSLEFKVEIPVNFHFSVPEMPLVSPPLITIPSKWLQVLEQYLQEVVRLNNEILEVESRLGADKWFSCHSVFSLMPSTIERHEQNRIYIHSKIANLVALLRESWLTLLAESPKKATSIAKRWSKSKETIWQRFYLFAVAQEGATVPIREWVDFLTKKHGELLLKWELFHEIMVLLRVKFDELHTLENKSLLDKLKKVLVNGTEASSLENCLLKQLEEKRLRTQDVRWDRGEFHYWREFSGDKYEKADKEKIWNSFNNNPVLFFTTIFDEECEDAYVDSSSFCIERDKLWYKTVIDESKIKVVKDVLNQCWIRANEVNERQKNAKELYLRNLSTVLFHWSEDEYKDHWTDVWTQIKNALLLADFWQEISYAVLSWIRKRAKDAPSFEVLLQIFAICRKSFLPLNQELGETSIRDVLDMPITQATSALIWYWYSHRQDGLLKEKVEEYIAQLMEDDEILCYVGCACFYNFNVLTECDSQWAMTWLLNKIVVNSQEYPLYFNSLFLNGGFYAIPFNAQVRQAFFEMAHSINSLSEDVNLYLYFFCYEYLTLSLSLRDDSLLKSLKHLLEIKGVATTMLRHTISLLKERKNSGTGLGLHDSQFRDWFERLLNYNKEAEFSLKTLLDLINLVQDKEFRNKIFNRIVKKELRVTYDSLKFEQLNELTDLEFLELCICFGNELTGRPWETGYKRRFQKIDEVNQKDEKYTIVSNILRKHRN